MLTEEDKPQVGVLLQSSIPMYRYEKVVVDSTHPSSGGKNKNREM